MRCSSSQLPERPNCIVALPPCFNGGLGGGVIEELMLVQALVPQAAVEALIEAFGMGRPGSVYAGVIPS